MDEQEVILGQYKTYSDAKEHFIDRHFATNRFYFVFSFSILVGTYLAYFLSPGSIVPMLITAAFGLAVSILWWLNIDSYQTMIKIKYARVLEYLETKLPESPFHKEYTETQNIKKTKNIMFADVQKGFAVFLLILFSLILLGAVYATFCSKNAVLF